MLTLQQRRLLSPGFSISYLNGLEPLMLECVQALVETVDLKCKENHDSAVLDVYTMLSNFTSVSHVIWLMLALDGLKRRQDVMSATSFGGSFNSVRTNNNRLKSLFLEHLKETAIFTSLSFLKWLPFVQPKKAAELDSITDAIVTKRLNAKDQTRRDLLQMMLDAHKANPESFTNRHLKGEMRLFM
jgi:cytochrome P450